jgi:tetratricopeptide (TPR) repeat protein
MHPKLIHFRFFTLLFLLFWSGLAHAQPPAVALVTTSKGTVSVRRKAGAVTVALVKSNVLHVSDIVATGANGKATLLFSDGSHVKLNSNTVIEITAPSNVRTGQQSLFRAVAGEVWARLQRGKAVQTRFAIGGVRGTEINLQVAVDGTTVLTVLEGSVDFYNELGAVVVNESQQSTVRPGQAPTAPVTVGNAGLLIEWTLDLNRALVPRERFYVSLDRSLLKAEMPRRAALARQNPNNINARRDYGDVLFDAGQFGLALTEYQAANEINSEPQILTRLGYTLLELDRLEEAENRFRAALGRPPIPAVIPVAYTNEEPAQESALTGLAWLELIRDQPAQAEKTAEPEKAGIEAQIVLGLALMRQSEKMDAAREAFQTAARLEPAKYRYQAKSWLGLVHQAQGDEIAALKEAKEAAKLAPFSALARGNLALIYFFGGKSQEATREAREATKLNPESVVARVVLGQSLLAAGDLDGAVRAAAQAVALDPKLPQARYLLGVAHAGRRDYVHAAQELRESLRLAPSWLPAANTLARVYTRMGRNREAVALLNDILPRHPRSDAVLSALGEVFYEQGNYREATVRFQDALKTNPDSALYHAGLARTFLDDNQLSAAINSAQNAVRLAPDIGQYHALLGLAYDFSRVSFQSEREYRAALALDPQNALARAMLGLKATDPTTTVDTFSQAFLFDPTISRQILRGGINTEIGPTRGNDDQQGFNLLHRSVKSDGKLHFLGGLGRNRDEGDSGRLNDDNRASTYRADTTWVPGPSTNFYFNLTRARNGQGLPGLATTPFGTDPDSNSNFGFEQGVVAMRQRFGPGRFLWLGMTAQNLKSSAFNGQNPFPLPFPSPLGVAFPFTGQQFKNRALIPEIRADFSLSAAPERPAILTLGAAYAALSPRLDTGPLVLLNPPAAPQIFPASQSRGRKRFSALYAELAARPNARLSLVAQLRAQRDSQNTNLSGGTIAAGTTASQNRVETHLLPSLLATFQADRKTTLRLLMNHKAGTTNLAFAPSETRLAVEPDILFRGNPRTSRTLEVDAERYISKKGFLKLYAFRATAGDVALGTEAPVFAFRINAPFTLGRLEQTGAGIRYEHRLSRRFFGQIGFLRNKTSNSTPGQSFDGQKAPYYPDYTGNLAFNYVGGKGNKASVILNRIGGFFQDRPDFFGLAPPAQRPRFSAETYVSVLLSREASVHNEIFMGVSNVFNKPGITFNDSPAVSDNFGAGRRRVFGGITRRF